MLLAARLQQVRLGPPELHHVQHMPHLQVVQSPKTCPHINLVLKRTAHTLASRDVLPSVGASRVRMETSGEWEKQEGWRCYPAAQC
mmetsp:Transcript_9944/g.27060  ORF Transcript_9944/g.27060 Transcript_9944/m.27060 type:complete len:86 (-) Transcript_9944:2110-2367(-)